MLVQTRAQPVAARRRSSPLAQLALSEARLFLREPLAVFWGVLFPVVLLIVLGGLTSAKPTRQLGGMAFINAYEPVLMVFTLAVLALSALPPVLAGYRERGYLRRLATTPVGPLRLLAAQLAISVVVYACSLVLIAAVGRIAYGVRLPAQGAGFAVALALGTVATLALGALLAAIAPGGRGANAIGALVTFPMMFFAGLWVPRAAMSPWLRHVSDFTPLGATVGAIQDSMRGVWPHLSHLAVLAAYALVLTIAAVRLFRWDQ